MKTHWKVFFLGLVVWFVVALGGTAMYKTSDHMRVKVSRDATMVQAYEYDERCGSKGRYNCSAYKGRFLIEPEHIYINREIDGFFYHHYVDNGRKDMASYVTVSKMDLGAKNPPYYDLWVVLMIGGWMMLVIWFIAVGVGCLFEDEEQRTMRRYRY